MRKNLFAIVGMWKCSKLFPQPTSKNLCKKSYMTKKRYLQIWLKLGSEDHLNHWGLQSHTYILLRGKKTEICLEKGGEGHKLREGKIWVKWTLAKESQQLPELEVSRIWISPRDLQGKCGSPNTLTAAQWFLTPGVQNYERTNFCYLKASNVWSSHQKLMRPC